MTTQQKKEFIAQLLKGKADISSVQPSRTYDVLSCNGQYDVKFSGEVITLNQKEYRKWLQTLGSRDIVFLCSIDRYYEDIPADLTPTKAFVWVERKQYETSSGMLN